MDTIGIAGNEEKYEHCDTCNLLKYQQSRSPLFVFICEGLDLKQLPEVNVMHLTVSKYTVNVYPSDFIGFFFSFLCSLHFLLLRFTQVYMGNEYISLLLCIFFQRIKHVKVTEIWLIVML